MVNRLTKSAEMQVRVDEEYFNINMEGHQMRLKWENTLKNCYQVHNNALVRIRLLLVSRVVFMSEHRIHCLAQGHLICGKR